MYYIWGSIAMLIASLSELHSIIYTILIGNTHRKSYKNAQKKAREIASQQRPLQRISQLYIFKYTEKYRIDYVLYMIFKGVLLLAAVVSWIVLWVAEKKCNYELVESLGVNKLLIDFIVALLLGFKSGWNQRRTKYERVELS